MKKLTLALSALAAVFGVSSANADVSVSGSGSAAYIAPAGTGSNNDGKVAVGQFVSFGLSTTTASGMTISGGMGLSNTLTTNNSQAVSGGKTLTFASGGASLTIGDVEASDTPGSVGGLVGDQIDDLGGLNTDVGSGFADDDGLGLSFTTAVGAATINAVYVGNTAADNMGTFDGTTSVTSGTVTIPAGAYTVMFGAASVDGTDESSAGGSISGSFGGGTFTVGYSTQSLDTSAKSTAAVYAIDTTNSTASMTTVSAAANGDLDVDGDTTVLGATYAMSLDADTSISVGYQSAKDADNDSATQVDAVVTRALGGGASVFLEMRSLSGDATTDGTAIAVGSRVSF